MFSNFGEQNLERVDGNASSAKITEWKKDSKTREAFNKLFSNHEILQKITTTIFKLQKGNDITSLHFAYVLSICDIVLNPKSPGIKCNDKSVKKRMDFLLVNH
jgi:hypothetical protein